MFLDALSKACGFFSFYNFLGAKNILMGWRAQLNSKVFAQHIESLNLFPPPHTHTYIDIERVSSLTFVHPQVYQKNMWNLSLWRYPFWFQGEGRRSVKQPLAGPGETPQP